MGLISNLESNNSLIESAALKITFCVHLKALNVAALITTSISCGQYAQTGIFLENIFKYQNDHSDKLEGAILTQ